LQTVRNLTPLVHRRVFKMGPGRRYFDVVVVKGAFRLEPGLLVLADEPSTISLADEPWNPEEAGRSSVRIAADAVLRKPATDLFVTGSARAPGGKPLSSWDTAVVVSDTSGMILRQHARVTGPRTWQHGAFGWSLTAPAATTEVPIRYELAYGGVHRENPEGPPGVPERWSVHKANPSGLGHLEASSLDVRRTYPAPQWESLDDPVSAPGRAAVLAGYGPVARNWRSRHRYAGTYDHAWRARTREEAERGLPPDYPADFDPRFFQSAHPSLVAAGHLCGGEQLGLVGLLGDETAFVTRLPSIRVHAETYDGVGPWQHEDLPLDTVHVDLEARLVHLAWRLTLDPDRAVGGVVLTHSEAS